MGLVAGASLRAILENELEPVKILACTIFCLATAALSRGSNASPAEPLVVQGLLMPAAQAKLASRAKGVIESIKREGDAVNEGDVVMELENTMEELQLDQQRHILDLRTFERDASDELAEKSVISKTEVEEKRVNHEVAKVQMEVAGQLLHMRKVEAPFEGVIAERLRERGEAVDEFTPVVTLVKLDKLYLEVFLPATRLREVKVGQPVRVTVGDLPGREFAGEVAEVSPGVNPASGEFKVRILVPNQQGELVAGTPALATFGTGG